MWQVSSIETILNLIFAHNTLPSYFIARSVGFVSMSNMAMTGSPAKQQDFQHLEQ